MLLLDDGHCLRDRALSFCARTEARELGFRATSLSTLAQMVAGGSGVTARTLALAWRRQSPIGDALRRLAVVLREACPPAA